MKQIIFITIIFLFTCIVINAQKVTKPTFEERNDTDRDLYVYKTEYYSDSTKAYASNQAPKGTSSKLFSEQVHIRIDFIVIDAKTKDTVCSLTASKKELESGLISYKIGLNTLEPPLIIKPRLRIKGADYRNVLKVEDPIELLLISNKKVSGNIINYNNNELKILNELNQEIVIKPKDIQGIKSCRDLLAYGARISILNNCKYTKVKSVKFDLVEQKFNEKERFWDWVKIQ